MKPYFETDLGKLYCGDCLDIMPGLDQMDMILTSPPYDNLRTYEGYTFDFEKTADQIARLMKKGAVCVWIVADQTIKGSETGTSFKQALYFKEKCGLNLHDTMIWQKLGFTATGTLKVRYASVFEYMFIFSNGMVKTFNPIKDRKSKNFNKKIHGNVRQKDGTFRDISNKGKRYNEFGQRFNIWEINSECSNLNRFHPAQFSEQLAADHIISWSNAGDIVLDPMSGSGTTLKMAEKLSRRWIGIEISEKYCEVAAKRIERETQQLKLFA